ncbi:hypothetical protein chiPu_0027528, partial [Chiloscyllium punctatum]|nr:hypothetical protein [Chiloscyllium punctatum]
MSQGRTPWCAKSTIRCLTTSGSGLPFTNMPPSWFIPPCPASTQRAVSDWAPLGKDGRPDGSRHLALCPTFALKAFKRWPDQTNNSEPTVLWHQAFGLETKNVPKSSPIITATQQAWNFPSLSLKYAQRSYPCCNATPMGILGYQMAPRLVPCSAFGSNFNGK